MDSVTVKDRIVSLYVDSVKSIPEISKETGICRSTVRYTLFKRGVLRDRTESVRIAAKNGKLSHMKGKKRTFTDDWKKNISIAKLKIAEENAIGTARKPNGYIEYTRGIHKYRRVHVVKMEAFIGRRLRKDEIVHHKDGNRSNNCFSNLQLMTRAEHASLHAKENCKYRERNKNGRFM